MRNEITRLFQRVEALIEKIIGTEPVTDGVSSINTKLDTLNTAIASIDTTTLRDKWNTRAGDIVTFSYYTDTGGGANPSGNANVQTEVYSNAGGTVLTNTYTYDAGDRVLTITTS